MPRSPTTPGARPAPPPVQDHRTRNAERKRVQMRARILMATLQVHSHGDRLSPVIDDVIRQAGISRGSFYKYFDSLDEALLAVGQEISEQFVLDLLPVHDVLQQPWQRFAVAFRLFLLRALADPLWAAFVSRIDVWPPGSLVARKMAEDLRKGVAQGQFAVASVDAATDFLKGASVGCILALRQGAADPSAYIDTAVRMGLGALGCTGALTQRAALFSAKYLDGWTPRRTGLASITTE